MARPSIVTRLSLPFSFALVLATDVPDAAAMRPAAASASPTPGAAPKPVAKPTLAATLGTLVSEQSLHLPCYAFATLSDYGKEEQWRRKLGDCHTAKHGASVKLAVPLQFPAVKGRIFLRELRCVSSPNQNISLLLHARISGVGSDTAIKVEKTDSDPAMDSYQFDDVEIDPKRGYDLLVDYRSKGTTAYGLGLAKGFAGCTLDYVIVG